MIETNASSNAATVSIYLLRSFIVSNVRGSLVYIFEGLKTMLLCIEFSPFHGLKTMLLFIEFSPFHPIIRPSVCQSVCT